MNKKSNNLNNNIKMKFHNSNLILYYKMKKLMN